MSGKAPTYLVLEDGTVFTGERLGAAGSAVGEVVFNTAMTGYQEMLTDPSYGGQILVPTYPMIGNYGVNGSDWESSQIQVRGFVVRQDCHEPSHPEMEITVDEYLARHGIPGISGIDTRAVTKRLRTRGVMMGVISPSGDVEDARALLAAQPRYGEEDIVAAITTPKHYEWTGEERHGEPFLTTLRSGGGQDEADTKRLRIVVDDFGVKFNILRSLSARGCDVAVVPANVSAAEILAMQPDGVLLSPGPGDPELLDDVAGTVEKLAGKVPIMGICLGHQVVARAFGGTTFKLPFGHRGGNHSVRDSDTGRIYVTAQNHGYAVSQGSLPPELEVTHVNLSDGTVEGLRHRVLPIMTIQYHSEASPGPLDNGYLFDRFVEMARKTVE